jgi:Spy/CpxP family protein refolding chaperone
MTWTRIILATLLISWGITAAAQSPAIETQDNREVLRMGLYPPDILMRQQQRLGITPEQRKAIAALVRDFQGQITELQWSMPAAQQALRDLLNRSAIDSDAALDQAARVLAMESEFKLAHFELLIAIKNELTTQQIAMLDQAIRRRLQAE